jgi:hypothetical protein
MMTTTSPQRWQRLIGIDVVLPLVLLLSNDFIWKYTYPGMLSGKLSDFAGLYMFPYFLALCFARPTLIYVSVSLAFVYWKLDISQPLIDAINGVLHIGMERTVDLTDLWALLVMPLSYYRFHRNDIAVSIAPAWASSFMAMACIFAFCATSLPQKSYKIDVKIDKSYVLNIDKATVFTRLKPRFMYSDSLELNLQDSIFFLYFELPAHKGTITGLAKVTTSGYKETTIRLDSIYQVKVTGRLFRGFPADIDESVARLIPEAYACFFEKSYIEPLKKNKTENLYFDNKKEVQKYVDWPRE